MEAVGSKQVFYCLTLLCLIVSGLAVAWAGIVWWDLGMVWSSGSVSRVQAERPGVLLWVVGGRAECMEELMVPPRVPPWFSTAKELV